MFQKFYTDTLGSRFIKSFLAQTPIPLFESVTDGDHLIEGCYYVYRRYIIQCVSSGILSVAKTEMLYPSETLYPSTFLYPDTGYKAAKFYVRSYVDEYSPKTHSVFKSTTNYYDSDTHYHLGRYLRYLNTTTELNLMPFYNCYNSKYFSDIELSISNNSSVIINRVASSRYKVVGIPILFGRTYSISIDCPSEVLLRGCIHDDLGFLTDKELTYKTINKKSGKEEDIYEELKTTLNQSGKILSSSRFNSPTTFRLEINNASAVMMQRNLYLVIQLPLDNESSIVVLENYDSADGVKCDTNHVRVFGVSDLSLLKMNTKTSYAFSDRLIEYLLNNVVHKNETISKNISKVQRALSNLFPDYHKAFLQNKYVEGVWNDDIRRYLHILAERHANEDGIKDQDGYVNKDIELLIYPKGDMY